MKKHISLLTILFGVLLLAACGFNEEKAIDGSKEQLKKFFHAYEDGEVISSMDKEKLKKVVHDKFSNFFTEDYLKKVDKEIDQMVIDRNIKNFKSPIVFFMDDNSVDEIVKFNQYKISEENEFLANKGDKTVTTKIVGIGTPENMFVEVTLKQENEKWKINDAVKN